jgi:predicted metal-dependent phosphoesterase TrpH
LPAPEPAFDLQSHSTHSDGELPPAQVIQRAAAAGVELVSLTDHDSLAGVAEAQAAAAGSGIACVVGVEISSIYEEAADLHMLGYLVDPDHRPLQEQLENSRRARETRASRMVAALEQLGYGVDTALLEARTASGKTVGRPHIAQAAVSHPANADRLAAEGLEDPTAFLVAYLIEGRPAFVGREAPSVEQAIEMIHAAGGLAVWAHPFWDFSDDARTLAALEDFVAWGLDGVEAFYATHTEAQTRLLAERCEQLGLLTTGSSDFHGPDHRQFNRFRAFQTYGLDARLGPLAPTG